MSKPSYGVIVGRFQVNELHDAHRELLTAVFARHKKVIVFLGVSPTGMTKRHPLDFATRAAMLKSAYPDVDGRSLVVLPLQDEMTDEQWSKSLDKKIREVVGFGDVTLYGGRDSFVPHYHGDYPPRELALVATGFSGEQIRAKVANEILASPNFRAGVIYGAMNSYNRVVTTVDVILYNRYQPSKVGHVMGLDVIHHEYQFLLGKKDGEPGWRFIGGHAEPTTQSFEEDARAEAMQESGLDIINLEYMSSTIVPDWRWAQEESKIKTLIFAAEVGSCGARPGSDIDEVRWFKSQQMTRGMFIDTHKPLYDIVKKYFWRKMCDQWGDNENAAAV